VAEEALTKERSESDTAYNSPWPLDALPAVVTRFVICTEDRIFPAPFMRRVAGERIDDLIVRMVPGAHKAVKWNQPFCGHKGDGWFPAFHCYTKCRSQWPAAVVS
jgi:hypothetical protein